jgi:RNA polymerase sigma-70 factor (ECF subfamily)
MAHWAAAVHESVLVLRCQAGDPAAFEQIIERYDRRLRYFMRQMLGSSHAVDDAMQDVWLDAWSRIGRLKDPEALAGWLYRMARDRAYRQWRNRRPVQSLGAYEVAVAAGHEEPSFTAEEAAQIHVAIDHLALEHREVLLLRFMDGMSYETMSQVIGCHVGTVRSRLHYAKRALRREIERQGHHGERT